MSWRVKQQMTLERDRVLLGTTVEKRKRGFSYIAAA